MNNKQTSNLSYKESGMIWLAILISCGAFLYITQDFIAPFAFGILFAYFLNPIVEKISRLKIPRFVASLIILSLFFFAILAFFSILAPILISQLKALAQKIPEYIDQLLSYEHAFIKNVLRVPSVEEIKESDNLKELIGTNAKIGLDVINSLISGISSGSSIFLQIITFSVLTPFITFFILTEWPHIKSWTQNLIPPKNRNTIMSLLKDIDKKISGFLRGQVLVALSMTAIYSIALIIADLNYALLIGILAGVCSIIPVVGAFVGLLTAVIVAWFQSYSMQYVLIIAGIFFGGQLIEGNILTPKLVGDSVGLHPLWIMFALIAGGSILGIFGMIIAVPIVASAGVIINFLIRKYKESPLYQDENHIQTKEDTSDKDLRKK